MSQTQPRPSLFDRLRPLLPLLVFVFAFGFRLIGIGWGLPNELHNQSYHPDGRIIFSWSQQIDPAHMNFTPGFYNYGTLYLSMLNVGSSMVKTYSGAPDPKNRQSVWAFMGKVDLVGRLISSCAGALTAVIVFLMLRRFTRPFGAIFGGLLLAVAPAFVVHSRFQTVDVTATMFLAASLYFSTLLLPATSNHLDPPDWDKNLLKYAILAGLFAGLSGGTKYTGILAILPLIVACFMIDRKVGVRAGIGGLVAALLGFLVGTPGALLDHQRFMEGVSYESGHVATGHGLLFVDVGSGLIYHLVNLGAGIGPLLLLLCGIGSVFALVKGQKWLWLLLAFSVPYYLLIGTEHVLFLRYTFPLYIVAAAGFGWWMGWAHERKGKHLFSVMAGIFALGLSLMIAARMTSWMASQDPRDQVALELKDLSKSSPKATVGSVSDPWFWSPPLIPDATIMRGPSVDKVVFPEMEASSQPKFERYLPKEGDRFDWDSRLLSELHPDYVVYSSFEQYDVDRLQNATDLDSENQLIVGRYKQFQGQLQQSYELQPMPFEDSFVRIQDLEYVRPMLWVWKRKNLP